MYGLVGIGYLHSTYVRTMNSVNALYAVTRLNWPEARQNSLIMDWYRNHQPFAFPVIEEFDSHPLLCNIDLPLQTPHGVPDSILLYIFGPNVNKMKLPAEWIHYIRASLNSLVDISYCGCCKHLLLRHSDL